MTNYDQRPEREQLQFDRQCENAIILRECTVIAFDASDVSFDEQVPETILGDSESIMKGVRNCD